MSGVSETVHVLKSIGVLRTPYIKDAPYQPLSEQQGRFMIELESKFAAGISGLDSFKYIYVVYYLDKVIRTGKMMVNPPWAEGVEVGVFASRSSDRPNPIGISVVEVKAVEKNLIYISGIDAFDNTPVLDVKPYIDELDAKSDANLGWVEQFDNEEHLALHLKGIPHKHYTKE